MAIDERTLRLAAHAIRNPGVASAIQRDEYADALDVEAARLQATGHHSLDADTLRMAADALQRPRFYRSPEIANLSHALDVEARAIEEGVTIPAPPADVREAMRAIVAYDWEVEARDFEENHAPNETGTGHVFENLQLVDAWLRGETS